MKTGMKRRHFLKSLIAGSAGMAMYPAMRASAAAYSGRFLVVVQANGGWDVTS